MPKSASDRRLVMAAVWCFFGSVCLAVYLLEHKWPWYLALMAIPLGAAGAYGICVLSKYIESPGR